MCSQTQSFRLLVTRSCGVLVLWKIRTTSAPGFSSCRSAHMNGVWIHLLAMSSTMQIWRLSHVTQLPTFLSFFICAPPISRALTASRAANNLCNGAWNVKPPSRSVDNAAGDVHNSQPPRASTAFAGKHSGCSLHVVTALSGVPHCSDSHVLPTWDRWS